MAHEIFGERFLGRKEPAWHGLGTVFAEERWIGAEEAVREVGADFEIVKSPIVTYAFGQQIPTEQFALVRAATDDDPTPRVLGTVGKDYEVVDNLTIARAIEPLTGIWPLETVGVLRQGAGFFVTLAIGTQQVAGADEVRRFFLVSGNHGEGSINVAVSAVRTVCANTVRLALKNATVNLQIAHWAGANADLSIAASTIGKLYKADESVTKLLDGLALKHVTAEQVNAIISAAYPEPAPPARVAFAQDVEAAGGDTSRFAPTIKRWEQAKAEAVSCREQARACYDLINDQFSAIAETAWAAVNAVTEVQNHRPGRSDPAYAIVFGERAGAMNRAMTAALSV